MIILSMTRVCFVLGVTALVACSVAEIPGEGTYGQSESAAAQACTAEPSTMEMVDVSTLTACTCKAGGKAHCVSAAKLPASLAAPLSECEGASGRCVPDSVLESGGAPFPKCRASGDEGRCVSLCVPKVSKYAEALTRGDGDTCTTEERCVPCKMPDGSSSGICEVGTKCSGASDVGGTKPGAIACPYTGTKMSVTQMPACAPGGRCVSDTFLEDAVADSNTRTELKSRLARCDADGYCMPEEYLKNYGQYVPPACTSFAGIEGRCFSTVFKDVGAQAELLPTDTCGARDRCIPCFNPADGSPSGACTTVTCDAPKTNPPVLKACCSQGAEMRGKCVPKGDVPDQFRSRLTSYECDRTTELCIPSENVDLKSAPAKCVPQSLFAINDPNAEGVCVSRCLVFGFLERLVFQTGSCRADQICAPCTNPDTGAPSGAPGCSAPAR